MGIPEDSLVVGMEKKSSLIQTLVLDSFDFPYNLTKNKPS